MCAMMQKFRTWAGPLVATADSRWITGALVDVAAGEMLRDDDLVEHDRDHEEHDDERQVEPAKRRDDAAHRDEHRLDQHREVHAPAPAQAGHPRQHRVHDQQQQVQFEDVLDDDPESAHGDRYTPGGSGSVAITFSGTPRRNGSGSMACPSSISW